MRAIVTGATKGIGKAVSEALAKEGYDLAIGARNKQEVEQFASSLEKAHKVDVFAKAIDFSNKEEVQLFCDELLEKNDVGIIVNSLGIYGGDTIIKEDDDLPEKMMAVNFYSAYRVTKPFLEGMKSKQEGHIFNICSVVNKQPRVETASYTISKGALYEFHKVLMMEMRDYKVKVTAIIPGSVNTSSWDGIEAPKEEFVQPEDIASCIVNALKLSPGATMEEIVIKPLNKDF